MKLGSLISLVVVFLALAEGGHLLAKKALVGAGLLKAKGSLFQGALSNLFGNRGSDETTTVIQTQPDVQTTTRELEKHCEIKWEDEWKPHCSTTYEKVCQQEPREECSTEIRNECWIENEEKCVTETVVECQTEYVQECTTEWVEECVNEVEEVCEEENECITPQEDVQYDVQYGVPSSSSSTYSSQSTSSSHYGGASSSSDVVQIKDFHQSSDGQHYSYTTGTSFPSSGLDVAAVQSQGLVYPLQGLAASKTQQLQSRLQGLANLAQTQFSEYQGPFSKRSIAEELEALEDVNEKDLAEALDIPADQLHAEIADAEIADAENDYSIVGESRKKRSLHFLKLALIGKHLIKKTGKHLREKLPLAILGGALAAPKIAAGAGIAAAGAGIGAGIGAASSTGVRPAPTVVVRPDVRPAPTVVVRPDIRPAPVVVRPAPTVVVRPDVVVNPVQTVQTVQQIRPVVQCRNVNKCYQRPVTKCQETPEQRCFEVPKESCANVPKQSCYIEPKEVCKQYPEEKCVRLVEESCWEEPREHCTEQRVKVARKWCHVEEPITGNEVW